jgi:hypothetical protein
MSTDKNNKQLNQISNKSMEMLVNNVLNKHGVSKKKANPLPLKEKKELKKLISDLENNISQLSRRAQS